MRRKARPGGGRQIETTIAGLGGRGDGLAAFQGRPVFAAYALPGERVRLKVTGERAGGFKAEVLEILEQSPARVEPPCPHFGPCGGCALQHLEESAYRTWKAALIAEALARAGVAAGALRPPISIPPGRRRRADFAALKRGKRMELGFHARESHEIVDLETCLLLTPGLLALIEPLRALFFELLVDGEAAEAIFNDCDNGLDLLLASARPLDLAARQQ
ncbi:MAG: class I SAM-dependent RNA methyltransferase, partial [Kiloniellales bacterium]